MLPSTKLPPTSGDVKRAADTCNAMHYDYERVLRLTKCVEWSGARSGDGYGAVYIDGKQRAAHRVAWEKAKGVIPDGMWILHRCDNPLCVNPDHLFLGTAKDNTQDCIRKGRRNTPRGSQHSRAKLTEDDVRTMVALSVEKRQSQIARDFGVSDALVSLILRGKAWKHVTASK
jgi:hypothetical protein